MKVLQAHSLHSARGGADQVVARERSLLVEAGHEIRQYLAPAAEAESKPAWKQAADVVWNTRSYRELRGMIREFEPDVVHVHTPFPVLSPAVFHAARAEGVPSVTTVHSYRYSCIAGTLRREGRVCEDCVGSTLKLSGLRHGCYHHRAASAAMTASLATHRRLGTFSEVVSRFLALTEFAREILVRDGVPPQRVVVKPNCVDDPGEPVPYGTRSPVFLFVGRLVPEKGIRTLLAAWDLLERPAARLVVVGDGPLLSLVQGAASRNPTISATGWLEPAEVFAYQARAAATVVCSEWYEGQPIVLLDALAHGTPLIVSDLDNLSRDVARVRAGRMFRTGDACSLAAAMAATLDDNASSAAQSAAGRSLYLAVHTPRAAVTSLESIYAEVCEEGSR